jgi:hypothetical protein
MLANLGVIQSDVECVPETCERWHLALETPDGETPSLQESHITLNRTRRIVETEITHRKSSSNASFAIPLIS